MVSDLVKIIGSVPPMIKSFNKKGKVFLDSPIYEDFGFPNIERIIEKMHKKIILTQMHWLLIKNGREGITSDDASEVFLRLNFQSSSVQKWMGL